MPNGFLLVHRTKSGLWWAYYRLRLYGPFDSRQRAFSEMILELYADGDIRGGDRLSDFYTLHPDGEWA